MNATNPQPVYTVEPTGRLITIRPECGEPYQLPEVRVVVRHQVGEVAGIEAVVHLADDYYYLVDSQWDYLPSGVSATLLVRERYGVDCGGNVLRKRTAPASTLGLTAPYGALPLTAGEGPPHFVLAE